MGTHYLVKGARKRMTGLSPAEDLLQPQNGRASEPGWIKVMMSDRVSPGVQLLDPVLTSLIAHVQILYFVPERNAESIVVFPNVPWIRIARIQLSVLYEHIAECSSQYTGWNALHEIARTFRVQVPAVPLKLGREQYGVCLIDLLSSVASSAAASTDTSMGGFHLIEFSPPHGSPVL
jgi:hypothetical protein